jgi:hypothetical protein
MRVLASSRRIALAAFLQRGAELASDCGLLSGHSLDGEEAHEAVGGGFDVDGHDDPLDVSCGG